MPLQIFVTGRMGSGKDEFAKYLVDKRGFVKTAFADGIRRFIRSQNPRYVSKSDRALEIDVGNSFRRWFGDHYWVTEAIVELSKGNSWDRNGSVISDGRFPMEYEICVNQRGFIHVHINADDDIRLFRLRERDANVNLDHFYSSDDCQIPVTESTIVIENNGTLDEFHAKIDELIERLQTEVSDES